MRLTLLIAALMAAPAAFAETVSLGNLSITAAVARETPKGARAGAGFMTIANTGNSDDRLIAVEADFPRVELHLSVFEDGVARMKKQDGLAIEAGGALEMKPGGYHVMFMGLSAPLIAGDQIPATLIFEQAGAVEVSFEVRPMAELMPKHGHKHQ